MRDDRHVTGDEVAGSRAVAYSIMTAWGCCTFLDDDRDALYVQQNGVKQTALGLQVGVVAHGVKLPQGSHRVCADSPRLRAIETFLREQQTPS